MEKRCDQYWLPVDADDARDHPYVPATGDGQELGQSLDDGQEQEGGGHRFGGRPPGPGLLYGY
jgi:hypothetical protein